MDSLVILILIKRMSYMDMVKGLELCYASMSMLDRCKRVGTGVLLVKLDGVNAEEVTRVLTRGASLGFDSLYTFLLSELEKEEDWISGPWLRLISYLISGEHELLERVSKESMSRVDSLAIDETRKYLEALFAK